jgi:glycosyltransferase involved in cell wall biosynthesis
LQPRKNYVRLIQAFSAVTTRHPALQLVIAGGKGWLYEAIFAEVQRLKLQERVVFPGFVADADLPALYSAARVLAYPSLYEGFGLPMLEAMACGTPVVTSTASCLPEVAGEAALCVPPTEVEALAHALEAAIGDEALRAELRLKGLARAKEFTWEKAARELVEQYRALLSSRD